MVLWAITPILSHLDESVDSATDLKVCAFLEESADFDGGRASAGPGARISLPLMSSNMPASV